jgi:outer membrane protein OmpA-like peptidoglycan-associated protein
MTLDSALRLLRDEQNDVKLNIPISGDINDPQFNIADAINQVLAKTLQQSALTYLKYMLGPYGIGISVAEFAYEQATKIRLNPIIFAPGNDGLDQAAIDYLQRVAAIMKEYPAVQVSVCGVATESDRTAMNKNTSTDTALLALAGNRADSIEDYLVKLNGIDATRIIACEPEIDKAAEAKPRADLGI